MSGEKKLAYLVTLESGKVFLAVVHGRNPDHGEKEAIRAVQAICPEDCWDACGHPGGDRMPLGVAAVQMPTITPRLQNVRPPLPVRSTTSIAAGQRPTADANPRAASDHEHPNSPKI
jgi:hypothetical protein